MAEHVKVPVRMVNGEKWGNLDAIALSHEICGEVMKPKQDISFGGGHRVRLVYFKKNVHWRIPVSAVLDISNVAPGEAPRKRN